MLYTRNHPLHPLNRDLLRSYYEGLDSGQRLDFDVFLAHVSSFSELSASHLFELDAHILPDSVYQAKYLSTVEISD